MTPLVVLADGPTGEAAKSGPWGLAIILLLCAGCYFLFKSMSKHLRKVREEFGQDEPKPQAAAGQDGDAAEAQQTTPSLTKRPRALDHAVDHAHDQDGEPAPETPPGTPPE
jgi:hypothetical protein